MAMGCGERGGRPGRMDKEGSAGKARDEMCGEVREGKREIEEAMGREEEGVQEARGGGEEGEGGKRREGGVGRGPSWPRGSEVVNDRREGERGELRAVTYIFTLERRVLLARSESLFPSECVTNVTLWIGCLIKQSLQRDRSLI